MLDIDQLLALSRDPSTLLHEIDNDGEVVQIHEHDGLRWAYIGGHALLSGFRPDSPGELAFPYHRYMLAALLLCERPAAVLNLGFGLGSFERWFHAHTPRVEIVSVDSSAILVEVSREWFQIPGAWPVLVESAHDHLIDSRRHFEVILCDLFCGGAHAPCLYDPNFYAAAAQRLSTGGVLSLNLSPADENELLQFMRAMRESFDHVMLATVFEHGNVVVLATQQAPAVDAELLRRARRSRDELRLELDECIGQFTRLPPRGSE